MMDFNGYLVDIHISQSGAFPSVISPVSASKCMCVLWIASNGHEMTIMFLFEWPFFCLNKNMPVPKIVI